MIANQIQQQAKAELKARTQKKSKKREGPYKVYRFNPFGYFDSKIDITPWSIRPQTIEEREHLEDYARKLFPYRNIDINNLYGQKEIMEQIVLAMVQQHEQDDYRNGRKTVDELKYWKPGMVIQNWVSVDAGHNVGKTFMGGATVNWFFDSYGPSIIQTYAPTSQQIKDLLWKDIKKLRSGKGLPGRILDLRLEMGSGKDGEEADYFAKGMATNDSEGKGTERLQGGHQKYMLFVIDEAEGVQPFVYDAIRSMMSGGVAHIVLVLRNPRTRLCVAHKIREKPNTVAININCFFHPNVVYDRTVVPEAVTRSFIEDMLEHTEIVEAHDPDRYTFELPWNPGIIYRPKLMFLWRVFGIASATQSDDTFCPVGRYEAARDRIEPIQTYPKHFASLGVDCARYGNDVGTLYRNWQGVLTRVASFEQKPGTDYHRAVKAELLYLRDQGVTEVEIRVDAGGGYGGTVIDLLEEDVETQRAFSRFVVIPVKSESAPYNSEEFYDLITEAYYHAGEMMKVIALNNVPEALESDLCERYFKIVKGRLAGKGLDVKRLVNKDKFRTERKKIGINRSPDDGDGAALALAPSHIFTDSVVAPTLIEIHI